MFPASRTQRAPKGARGFGTLAGSFTRPALAAALSLAAIAGCATLPTVQPTKTALTVAKAATAASAAPTTATGTAPAAAAADFVSTEAAAAVTSDSAVTDETAARAMAINDETLIEAVSAALEGDEADLQAAFSVAGVGQTARATAQRIPVGVSLNLRQAVQPVQSASFSGQQLAALQSRRTQAQARVQTFAQRQPTYASEADQLREAVAARPWQANEDDATTLMRQCDATLTLQDGRERRIQLVRVVGKGAKHPLVSARLDMEETCTDGSTKVVRWEKHLQADGAYQVVYHHEIRSPQGPCWVTDWDKQIDLAGRIRGKGTFLVCDQVGRPIKQQPVELEGDDTRGCVVKTPAASPSPSPTPTPTPTVSPSPEVSESPSAEPSPAPTATPCTDGSVTGGGRLAATNYAFGFGPQLITINDVADSGNDYQADVRSVVVEGATATLTGTLRAPRTGTITLYVTDNGEGEGDPDDTVSFLVGTRFIASGPLTRGNPGGGNVQVRPDCD